MILSGYQRFIRRILVTVCAYCVLTLVCFTFAHSQDSGPTETDAVELFNRGQEVHEKGDLKAAIGLYEKALKIVPEFPEAHLQRGSALLGLERVSEAEAAFRKAVGFREDWSLAYAYLGNVLVRQGKFDEAKSTLIKAIELDADNTPAWATRANLAIRTKASESELRAILKQISIFASAARPTVAVLTAKASLELALKDDKAAAVTAMRVLQIDARNIPMFILLFDMALTSRDLQKANEMVRQIEIIDANAGELPVLKIRSLIASGKAQEAIGMIDATKSPSKELLDIKAQIAASTDTSVPALEKRVEADARDIAALSNLCSLLRKSEPLRAMDFCKRAAEIEPNNLDHAIGYGAAMLQAKQYPSASALFQKLVNLAPDNHTVRANLATALFQQKRYTEAKVHLIWLAEKQPTNAISYFFLAIVHDELGEYGDAMANYQMFLKYVDSKLNQLEIEKVNLRLPTLQKQLDAGKGRSNAGRKGKT